MKNARRAAAALAVLAAGLASCKNYIAVPYDARPESVNVEMPDGNGTGDRPATDMGSSNAGDASDTRMDAGGSVALAIDSAAHDFGMVVTGTTSADATFVVTNTGTAASASLSAALSDAAKTAGFSIKTDHCSGMSLGGGSSCQIAVVLVPATAGSPAGDLTISGGTGVSLTAHLTATAILPGALRITPDTQSFGMVAQNQGSSSQTFTITNGGQQTTGAMTVALGGTDKAEFQVTADGCGKQTLAVGTGTCQITVRFAPTGLGAKSASLTVSASPGGTAVAQLSGTGITPPCGGSGQGCCTGTGLASCNASNLVCSVTPSSSTCVACGGSGQPCCGGAGGTCTASGTVCGTSASCVAPTGNGVACGVNPQCASGNCNSGICCAANQSGCSGSCVALGTDNSNCGRCSRVCAAGTETCTNGTCLLNNAQPCTTSSQCVTNNCALCYPDKDGDGFGDKWATPTGTCGQTCPAGLIADNRDCLDDPIVFPQASAVNPNGTFHLGAPAVPFPFAQYTPDPRDTSPDPWDYNCDDVREVQTTSSGGCAVGATCTNGCMSTIGTLYDASTCGTQVAVFTCMNMCSIDGTCASVETVSAPQGCK